MAESDKDDRKPSRDGGTELARLNECLKREIAARQAVEQLLRIKERHFDESQRLAGIGSWEYDPATETAVWSDEMYRIYGRTPESFTPTLASVLACTPPEDLTVIADTMSKVRATLQPAEYRHRFAWPDGSVRWLRGLCNFTANADGSLAHFVGVAQDITENHVAETNLRLAETRYRMLADSIPDMMYLVEPGGTVLYANTFAAKQFELTPEQMVGKRQQDLFTPEVAERHARMIRQVAETGHLFVAEVPDVLDPQHPVWIDTRLIPIRDSAGRVTSVMGLSRDVTERRLMTAALQESEQKYRQLFESMNEGCLVYDLIYDSNGSPVDALMIAMNPAAEAIFGMPAATLIGKRASEVVPTGRPLFLDIYVALDRGQPPVTVEAHVAYVKKDLSTSFFSPRKGRIAAIFSDISVRKAAEEKMAHYQQQLRHLTAEMAVACERERRDIAVSLHDGLGQALVLCKMKLESVKADADSPVKRQLQPVVRLIEEAIRDTRSLTFQLSPPVLHEIGLSAAVEWLAEQLGEQHGVTIRVSCKAPREPAGLAERVTLFQSVRELLLNTIKHARATVIAVDIRMKRDHLEIVVKDDGAGFDPETLQGKSRKGLGLFNIRERLQLIGGEMTIRSQPGKGTRVTLVAPVESPAGQEEEEANREHPNRTV